MLSASNFAASIFTVICVFWARIILNEHNSVHCLVAYKMNMPELQSLKSLTWVCFCYCPPQYPVALPTPPPFFYMGKLRRSNYYLTNLFKSKVSACVSPRKMAGCVFKFWIVQLNLTRVHCFRNASKMEHCAFDGCFWSLIKTLKGQRIKDWSKLHSLTIHTAQSRCRNQLHRSCVSTRMFV